MHIEKNHVRTYEKLLTFHFTLLVTFNWDTFQKYLIYSDTCISIYFYIILLISKFQFCCSELLPSAMEYLHIPVHALYMFNLWMDMVFISSPMILRLIITKFLPKYTQHILAGTY
mgnify:CR=1 FL=1